MTFTWFGRQMETANVGNTAISYEYNSDGLRTEKKVGNTVHTYEYTGSTLYYENRGGIQLHYRYDVNGNLASITRIDTDGTKFTLYAVCNSRGDVEELRNLSGSLYARYVYDTWGNTIHVYNSNGAEITSTGNLAVQNPIRYRGYYYDAETGFYYLQSRYYDPVTCRFINADGYVSTGQGVLGTNMFAYCGNNAVIFIDPTGYLNIQEAGGGCGYGYAPANTGYYGGGAALNKDSISLFTLIWRDIAGTVGYGALVTTTVIIGLETVALREEKIKTQAQAKTEAKTQTQKKKLTRDPVHHIVAKADWRAEEARQILLDAGINPRTDPRNLVRLPQMYHASMHTTLYHQYVTSRLKLVAGNNEAVESTLFLLKMEIIINSQYGIRWD